MAAELSNVAQDRVAVALGIRSEQLVARPGAVSLEHHGTAPTADPIAVLLGGLEDLAHGARCVAREDDPVGAHFHQPVLANAVREVLRDLRREQVDRLARIRPRRDAEVLGPVGNAARTCRAASMYARCPPDQPGAVRRIAVALSRNARSLELARYAPRFAASMIPGPPPVARR